MSEAMTLHEWNEALREWDTTLARLNAIAKKVGFYDPVSKDTAKYARQHILQGIGLAAAQVHQPA